MQDVQARLEASRGAAEAGASTRGHRGNGSVAHDRVDPALPMVAVNPFMVERLRHVGATGSLAW